MMTPVELNKKGFQALVNALGYEDAIRFLKLYDHGKGDYTNERYQWLEPLSLEDIFTDIQERESKGKQ
jgi:hypothetical protein